jgi:hypothetical protein
MGRETGFDGDGFKGRKILGLQEGEVVRRDDPEGRSRVKVRIAGLIDTESAWASPGGGGAKYFGKNSVPPLGATVDVLFVNGDIERPKYWCGDHGVVDGESQVFPEHTSPDVHVFGIGPFRLVIDNTDGQKSATAKAVREVDGVEESMIEVVFNYEDNSLFARAESAVGLLAGAILDLDSGGDVQVKGRKLLPSRRTIN